MLRHVRRRFNSSADALPGRKMDLVTMHVRPPWPRYWRARTDGGASAEGGGTGWRLDGANDPRPSPAQWRRLADESWVLPAGARTTEAELMVAVAAASFVCCAWPMGATQEYRRPECGEVALNVAARPRALNLRRTTGARGGGRERGS